ncbi:MAG: hypothetical protein IPK13_23460 [Deltaproteobacteria bacterium]|nr:hypothetical protein [Deltaproteobacteria bacterium]
MSAVVVLVFPLLAFGWPGGLGTSVRTAVAAKRADDTDDNARGYVAFRRKAYRRAHALFEASTRKAPRAAFGWLNLARTTYQLNKMTATEDLCDLAQNWSFRVLALLSRAVEIDQGPVLEKLDRGTAEFAFKREPLYEKWRWAVALSEPGGVSKPSLAKMMAGREMWPIRNTFPETWFVFEGDGQVVRASRDGRTPLGRWEATEGAIVARLGKQAVLLRPKRSKFYFDEGKSWYDFIEFQSECESGCESESESEKAGGPWGIGLVLGPRYGDCGSQNF